MWNATKLSPPNAWYSATSKYTEIYGGMCEISGISGETGKLEAGYIKGRTGKGSTCLLLPARKLF